MDLSEIDSAKFKQEIRNEMRAVRNLMLGLVVSAATASIVGAINLVLGHFG